MSPQRRKLTPIERFLGPMAATGSPFDLLGVSPESAAEDEVQAALRRRLARVASRPDGNTPEAGEVRLALHAAAAQLCDPRVRAHLTSIWSNRARSGRPAIPAPTDAQRGGLRAGQGGGDAPSRIDMFRASALRVLARSGGWNRRSRRRVAALAHAMGLRPAALATALRAARRVNGSARVNGAARALPVARVEVARAGDAQLNVKQQAPAAVAASAPARGAAPASQTRALAMARRRLRAAALAALAIAFAISAALLLFRAGASGPANGGSDAAGSRQQAPATSDGAAAGNASASDAARAPSQRAQRRAASDGALDASAVREAAAALARAQARRADGSAAVEARAALATVAEGWPALAPDPLRDAVIASARLWSRGARVQADAGATLDAPSAPTRLAFLEGVDSAAETLARTESALEAVQAFLAEARAQLASAPARMPPLAQAQRRSWQFGASSVASLWSAWMDAAEALDALEGELDPAARPAAASILALDALELVMTQAPPDADASVAAAIKAMAPRVQWVGEGSASRVAARRLLAWFADSRIGADDLAALTRALHESGSIPGMRAEMLLPPHAGRSPRLTQRDRYARLLGVEALASPQALPATWRREALSALRALQRGGIVRSLRDAAFFARLNHAAAARWAGDASASAQITANIHDEIERSAAGDAAVDRYVPLREAPRDDGVWAARVRSMGRSVEDRARALFDIEARAAALGPADADVLALLALTDPDANVRARAQRLIARLRNQTTIINGVLEALPDAKRTLSVAGLIEELTGARLPPPDSEQWLPEAQRALAGRLLGALEETAVGQGVDALAQALRDAHAGLLAALPNPAATFAATAGKAGQAPGPTGPGADREPLAIEQSARALLAEALLAGAGLRPGGTRPADLTQRWRVRAALADGPAQRATAWSTAGAEALALLVEAERPGDAGAARRVLLLLAAMQDVARNSPEQLALAEASQTVLWMLRFGDGAGVAQLESAAALRSLQATGSERSDADAGASRWSQPAREALAAGAWARFELAEEVADQADTPGDRALAHRLYAAALDASDGPGVRSVSLGLWQLATSDAERQWLLAIARADNADHSAGLFDWRSAQGLASLDQSADVKQAAAEALLLHRAGERGRAWRLLQDNPGAQDALRRALHGYPGRGDDALLDDMQTEPTCRQCHNARYIKAGAEPDNILVCPVCHADPGPDLDGSALVAVLRAELALLGAPPTRWSSTLRSADVQSIPVLEPALLILRYRGEFPPAAQ